jgi:hypothetical protein
MDQYQAVIAMPVNLKKNTGKSLISFVEDISKELLASIKQACL